MSTATNLISNNFPGYGLADSRCLPCSGVSGKGSTISSRTFQAEHRLYQQVKFVSAKCISRGPVFVCKAGSGSQRRNPDFSRQSRHGFSQSRNSNEEKDGFENIEDSDVLSSKNGPLLSLSSAPKSQATATPGPREKEIVKLFRKVQAQLRERAAMKEEKKSETLQGQTKSSDTVDSLLKLLRKHSAEQGKRSGGSSIRKELSSNKQEQNNRYGEGRGSIGFDSNSSSLKNQPQEPAKSLSRPLSKFQRKSPVPRVKFQPVFSEENNVDSLANESLYRRGIKDDAERNTLQRDNTGAKKELEMGRGTEAWYEEQPDSQKGQELEPESELEPELEIESESEDIFHEMTLGESTGPDDVFEDENGGTEQVVEQEDFNALKLSELRALAKSRGLRGYSKMKKSELVQLLNEGQD